MIESEPNLLNLDRPMGRRALLQAGTTAGLGLFAAGLLAGCGGSGNSVSTGGSMDQSILNAAATAEALAVTMYFNIINANNGVYQQLSAEADDQTYLVAAFEQELNHYNFLLSAGGKSAASTFYFPTNMFVDPQTTINTLVLLEDAFIAAYLIGVRDFSSSALKVYAAQIMGVEAEHRTLARVIAHDLNLSATTGLNNTPESVLPPSASPNNLAYERTFSSALPNISAVVTALGPFIKPGASGFSANTFTFASATTSPSANQTAVTLNDTTPSA